ncbi:LegC family aminotransferase [Clostridium hydrogeniformans]|uniref:LegC family aminotransferase n=1 Tax=Clostridium hydrogeniformans TaxID=349933 RepID=UPI000482C4FB|nr:LegC family aminotransferase [Clostridium hydrogeniformans]
MIPLCIPQIEGNEWKYIKECLDTNWVSSVGAYVDKFEKDFADYVGAKEAVVTMNGTAALELGLRTLGIGEGDEVIVPSLTFISPVNAIKYVGAEPVFIDVCRNSYVLDTNKIEELITPKTKAILPVHLYGNSVEMDKVMEIANKYNLYVIEDATENLGGLYKGKHAGTIGHIGCYSFNGNKIITTGSGGMLVTNNDSVAKRAKHLSTQTKTVLDNGGFYHDEIGYNFRMPNILAAMGCAQLEKLDEYVSIKRKNANIYNAELKDIKGVTIHKEKECEKGSYWLYSVLIEEEYGLSRDELILRLMENKIQSRPFFMPIHEMPMYKKCRHGNMDNTIELCSKGINLPSSVSLEKDDIIKIVDIIKRYR